MRRNFTYEQPRLNLGRNVSIMVKNSVSNLKKGGEGAAGPFSVPGGLV
jgi:hypothetical protein